MAKSVPRTPAIHYLLKNKAQFTGCFYKYLEHGGTNHAATALGVDEHAVIKTLVMEDEKKNTLLILMHGDRDVSTKAMARLLKCKSVITCTPAVANRQTGYQVGGISPFGTRKDLPVYMEITLMDLDWVYINGGRRGFLVRIAPSEVLRVLKPQLVTVSILPKGD